MPSSYNTAYQETMTLLKAALDGSADYTEMPVEWPNVEPKRLNEQNQATENPLPWIRVQWQHGVLKQRTIGSSNGLRRYEAKGLLVVSHFHTSGQGVAGTGAFSTFCYGIFLGESTTSGVIYRPQSPRDVQKDGLWYRSDAMIEFQYDEIK